MVSEQGLQHIEDRGGPEVNKKFSVEMGPEGQCLDCVWVCQDGLWSRPAACALKVALDKVIKEGVKIDAMFENIIKQGKYVDISRRGGELEVVNRMIRNMMYNDNNKPE